jgi:hypothetical protein
VTEQHSLAVRLAPWIFFLPAMSLSAMVIGRARDGLWSPSMPWMLSALFPIGIGVIVAFARMAAKTRGKIFSPSGTIAAALTVAAIVISMITRPSSDISSTLFFGFLALLCQFMSSALYADLHRKPSSAHADVMNRQDWEADRQKLIDSWRALWEGDEDIPDAAELSRQELVDQILTRQRKIKSILDKAEHTFDEAIQSKNEAIQQLRDAASMMNEARDRQAEAKEIFERTTGLMDLFKAKHSDHLDPAADK